MRELTYATVCSGIECMSAACADLPMRPVFFSEIEPFPCAVLKSHFPNVPNLGDMSKITVTNEGKGITNGTSRIVLDERLDIFAGGTPCQDVSVAGKRSGMQEGSGTRSSLAFEFVRLVRELRPRFVIWENVAGVLSDKSFPEFLTALADCGYGVAYRTLDAQWVRVADCYHKDGGVVRMERAIPQRRRRVWVVGCAGGDVAKASQILFEPKGVAGDNAPRRRTGQEIDAALRGRNRLHGEMVGATPGDGETIALDGDKLKPRTDQRKGGNGFGINEDGAGYTLTGVDRHGVAYKRTWWDNSETASTLTTGGVNQFMSDKGRFDAVVECYANDSLKESDVCRTLTGDHDDRVSDTGTSVVHHTIRNGSYGQFVKDDVSGTLETNHSQSIGNGTPALVISTNSNGGDVMPTLTNDLAKQTGNQQAVGGGYIIHEL